ncbi:MAG: hypothetical protein ACK55R_07210 [Cyanobacteriota bacterium]|jgi:hypothetical protein
MRFWFSLFPLEPKLQEQLTSLGLQHDKHTRHAPAELLLLYDAPHALALSSKPAITVAELTASYRRLIALARAGATAVAIPRLQALKPNELQEWFKGKGDPPESPSAAVPSTMTAVITLTLLELRPALLEAYLDLELHADLLGGRADSQYLARLQKKIAAVEPDHLLGDWQAKVLTANQKTERIRQLEMTLAERDDHIAELERMCSRTNLTLGEHRQREEKTQALLEECRAESAEQQKLLAALHSENKTLESTLEEQSRATASLRAQSQTMADQIREAHVELERTFLESQRGLELGRQCQVELRRAETLLLDLL